jgi:hypothetical protein
MNYPGQRKRPVAGSGTHSHIEISAWPTQFVDQTSGECCLAGAIRAD